MRKSIKPPGSRVSDKFAVPGSGGEGGEGGEE